MKTSEIRWFRRFFLTFSLALHLPQIFVERYLERYGNWNAKKRAGMTEFVENTGTEAEKQDCERKAAKRLMERLKERRYGVKFCVSEIRQSQGRCCGNRAKWRDEPLVHLWSRWTRRYARRLRRECRLGRRDRISQGVSLRPGQQT